MKFTANTTDLAAVLAKCAAITPGRSPLPILSNVLLCAENGQVKVKSTDLDLLLAASIEADVDEEGAITLPAKRLAAIVKEMPSETVTITLDGQNAKLASGKSRVTLNGLSAEEFPVLDDDGEGRVISMQGSELTGVIRRIAFAASTDESRYILNGVLLEFKEGDLKAVATDGKRLAVESLSGEGLEGEDFAKIIPNKAIHAIKQVVEATETFTLTIGETFVEVDASGGTLRTKLIEGTFPNWRQVMPGKAENVVTIEREPLLAAVKRVGLLANEKTNAIKIEIEPGLFSVSSISPEIGEASETVPCQCEFSEAAALNPVFLQQCLSSLTNPILEVGFRGEGSPITIADDGFEYVLMPMRAN